VPSSPTSPKGHGSQARRGPSSTDTAGGLPSGAAEYAEFIPGGADSACGNLDEDSVHRPTIRVPGGFYDEQNPRAVTEGSVPRGFLDLICVFGFATGEPVSVTLTGPDGTQERKELCSSCRTGRFDTAWVWTGLPRHPLGDYGVAAEQGETRVAGTFSLTAATEPTLVVRESWDATNLPRETTTWLASGTTVHLDLMGFEPSREVAVLLYYAQSLDTNRASFHRSIPIRTDADGNAAHTLSTGQQQPGCYAVRTLPPVDVERITSQFFFCVK
jgi:hypothetical protein